MKPLQLNLDIKNNSYEELTLMQGYTYPLEATLTDGGQAFDLTGHTVTLELLKADNTFIIQSETITTSGNVVKVAMIETDFTRASGTGKLQVVARKGGLITGSWVVNVRIKEGAIVKAVGESKDIITIKETIDNTVQKAIEENKKTEQLIATGGAATKGEIAEINSQLDNIAIEKMQYRTTPNKQVKNVVTFYFDDGIKTDITLVKPIADSKNIKCNIAQITGAIGVGNSLNKDELLMLQNSGWEIDSHTVNHKRLSTLSDEELDYELRESKKQLENIGINVNGVCFPEGYYNGNVSKHVMKYYKWGLSSYEFPNRKPITQGAIRRIFLDTKTLAQLKAEVDKMNNTYLIFYSHTYGNTFNAEMQQKLSDLIDYVQSKNIEITTVSNAMQYFSNNYQIVSESGANTIFAIDDLGNIYNQQMSELCYIKINTYATTITNTTPISSFASGKITIGSFAINNASDIPYGSGVGTLITYRINDEDTINFQQFYPKDNSGIAIRYWTSSGWGAWIFTAYFDKKTLYFDQINGGQTWALANVYNYTSADLDFRLGGRVSPPVFGLDENKNIKFNFTGNIGTAKGCNLYGVSTSRPTFTGTASGVYEWVEIIDGIPQKFCKLGSNGRTYALNTIVTDSLPTSPLDGQQVYSIHTGVRKPLWYDANSTKWKDAMGNVVANADGSYV